MLSKIKIGQFIDLGGIKTHYFEAGIGNSRTVILLHSAEFGGAAEFSWEKNIDALAKRYHVLAPDHVGFGLTDKIFDFENHSERRIKHISAFLAAKNVKSAIAIGSSMSGTLALGVAARSSKPWPITAVISCSGGGEFPKNEARDILSNYDGSIEQMRQIVGVLFHDPRWMNDDEYIERRHIMSLRVGAWEAASAARFRAPFRIDGAREREDYGKIDVPTLVMAGRWDKLRTPGYEGPLTASIPNAQLHIFEAAGHMGNIECSDEFNEVVGAFIEKL